MTIRDWSCQVKESHGAVRDRTGQCPVIYLKFQGNLAGLMGGNALPY